LYRQYRPKVKAEKWRGGRNAPLCREDAGCTATTGSVAANQGGIKDKRTLRANDALLGDCAKRLAYRAR